MTRAEFENKLKTLNTDDEILAFEEIYLNVLTDEDRERIGAAAIPFIELCGFIKRDRKKQQ